jgi:bile acid:Na+ symporter, BASS family
LLHDDFVLIAAIAGSVTAGVLLPATGRLIEPYILVWLGALLFLNLLRLNSSDLVAVFKKPKQIAVLSIMKIVALPAGMYFLAYVIYEPFALPILLLSGISTGLGAPFVVNLIGGQLPLVIGMIIVTSIAVPFVLPSIVYALARSQFEIPLLHMMFLLSIALFTPLAAGWLTKKYFPAGSKFADRNSFHLSLIFNYTHKLGHVCQVREIFLFRTDVPAPNCGNGISLLCCLLYSRVCRIHR